MKRPDLAGIHKQLVLLKKTQNREVHWPIAERPNSTSQSSCDVTKQSECSELALIHARVPLCHLFVVFAQAASDAPTRLHPLDKAHRARRDRIRVIAPGGSPLPRRPPELQNLRVAR